MALSGILGPYTLVSKTFVKNRAKALSFVNLPLMLLVVPYVTASLLPVLGRTFLYSSIGLSFLLLAPMAAVMLRAPKDIFKVHSTEGPKALLSRARLLPNSSIWLLAIGVGIVAGTGAAYYVHAVPFGLDRGLSLQAASGLVSSYAGAGIFGTLLFGWIADRIGPAITLTLSAALQAPLWWMLFTADGYLLFLAAGFLGMCAVPQNTLLGATSSALFGSEGAKAMGLCFAIKLPFLFGFAPLLGILFETSSDYRLAFAICALTLVIATASLGLLWAMSRTTRQSSTASD